MATGYTRQSAADIITGLVVEAAPLNLEFNALQTAFDITSGHNHDGTAGGGAKIDLVNSIKTTTKLPLANGGSNADLSTATTGATITKGATALTYLKNNVAGTAAPAVTDDSASSYGIGSIWYDITHGLAYMCVDATVGAAVWVLVTGITALATALGKVKVTANDTTPAVLNSKITVSGSLTKSTTSPGGNEGLNLDFTFDEGQTALYAGIMAL